MNERIKELALQASVWCDENIPEQFSEETNGYGSAWEEKFAALVEAAARADEREECAKLCMAVPRTGAYFARLIRARGTT